jgi:Protein of unknown function (DUF3352)
VRARLAVLAAGVALLAGCGGGGGGGTVGGGASIAPGDAAGYVSIETDTSSTAWHNAMSLLDRFPGKERVLSEFRSALAREGVSWERDINPALGDELDLVWLDFRNGGDNVVGLTQPKDQQKFDALLAHGDDPPAHETVDGWTVFADTQAQLDQFESRRKDADSLDDVSTFDDAMGDLPDDALAKAFVSGKALQTQIERQARRQGAPTAILPSQITSVESIGAALTPESDGVRIEAHANGVNIGGSTFHETLPASLPAGALAYLSFHDVGASIRQVADQAGSQNPSFDRQRAQVESAIGFSIDDLADLLSGEQAIAVYGTPAGAPALVFVSRVADESKARRLVDKLGALAQLGGTARVRTLQVGPIQATQFTQNGTSVYAGVFSGNLLITNVRSSLVALAKRSGTLAGDPAFKEALAGAGKPSDTSGFLYLNLDAGLPYAYGFAAKRGERVPLEVRANTAPLGSLLLYSTKNGDQLRVSGFLAIQ